jgi:hypothetical protein
VHMMTVTRAPLPESRLICAFINSRLEALLSALCAADVRPLPRKGCRARAPPASARPPSRARLACQRPPREAMNSAKR